MEALKTMINIGFKKDLSDEQMKDLMLKIGDVIPNDLYAVMYEYKCVKTCIEVDINVE